MSCWWTRAAQDSTSSSAGSAKSKNLSIVGTTQSGAAAIRMTGESRPDLVWLYIVMPGLDGLSALRTIRAMHPEVEVARVSSLGGDLAKTAQAFKLGACEVIAKPFDAGMIEALIEKVRSELGTVRLAVG